MRGHAPATWIARPLIALSIVGLALVGLAHVEAHAGSGFTIRLPDSPQRSASSPTTGLSMTLDTHWVGSVGYRPVRCEFVATTARQRDREITIELNSSRRNREDAAMVVKRSFLLRAGETRVGGEILLPAVPGQQQPWDLLWWDTRVDDVRDPALSIDKRRPRAVANVAGSGQSADLTLYRPAVGFSAPRRQSVVTLTEYKTLPGIVVDEASGPPRENWIDYSGVDVVLVDRPEFDQLAADETGRAALLRWVAAGGTLWVERVEGVKGLNLLAEQLGGDGGLFGIAAVFGDRPLERAAGWRYESLAPRVNKEDLPDVPGAPDLNLRLSELASTIVGRDSRKWYAVRGYGFGTIQAFAGPAFLPPDNLNKRQRERAIDRWRGRDWASRHGLAPATACRQFGNLLIPGVGTAPVGEFQVLITMFVIGIGPLNYWLLRRARRLHLLVLTTPLAAAAVTLGLIAYALVSDGFGVKARVRSVTLLSQNADGPNEAASWSRVSHYAASAPGETLSFDDQTAVYPILPAWESAISQRGGGPRVVDWSAGRQTLERGWLPTRTATQHLVVRSGETDRAVRLSPAEAPREFRNELGATLDLLLVHGAEGEWLSAEGVDDGATGRLAAMERLEAVSALRSLLLDNEPEFPLGAGKTAEETVQKLRWGFRPRRGSRDYGQKTLEENLMNKALDRLVGLEGGAPLSVPPKTYVAVTRSTVTTPLGFERSSVEEIGSFHVVLGRW